MSGGRYESFAAWAEEKMNLENEVSLFPSFP